MGANGVRTRDEQPAAERAAISIRAPQAALAEIDRRAGELGMTRTAFMLRSALGVATADAARLDSIERRLDTLERAQFGGLE